MSVNSHLLVSGFESVASIPRYRNLWLCDAKWFELMNYHVRELKDIEGLTLSVFIRAVNRHYKNTMDVFTPGENTTGVFHMSFTMSCPMQETRRKVHFYYVTKKGTMVTRPTEVGQKFTDIHRQTIVPLGPPLARNTMAVPLGAPLTRTTTAPTTLSTSIANENEDLQPSKRARVEALLDNDSEMYYWKSPEAAKLFLGIDRSLKRFKKTTDGEDTFNSLDIEQTITDRIRVLKSVQQEVDGWKKIVYTHDVHDACSPTDVFILRQKSLFLSRAYEVALDKMPFATWNECCQQAIDELSVFGFILATNSRTIATWNQSFRKVALFPHPNPIVASGLSVENQVFAYFPEAKTKLVAFARENLATLSVDSLHAYIIDELIPFVVSRTAEDDDDAPTKRMIRRWQVKLPSPVTAWRWLHSCGFSYNATKKSFYVDGHERVENKLHRKQFVTNFLTKWEPRCHRWIQLPVRDLPDMERSAEGIRGGYHYIVNGEDMVECHVDDNEDFMERGNQATCFGGWLSVRRDVTLKPMMIWGQDECAFQQHRYSPKQWVGPDGTRAILPKSDGYLMMISAFQSREMGFAWKLTHEELERVNNKRQNEEYVDQEAAIDVTGKSTKDRLSSTPFVRVFDPGQSFDGYWSYSHMAVQTEDCMDCLKVLLPGFDHLLLFDYSSGHSKKRVNGLDVNAMAKNYGGNQSRLRDATIYQEEGILGPFPRKLSVGDVQEMVFRETDDGPFWLSPAERVARRVDTTRENTEETREKTKAALYDELTAIGVSLPRYKNIITKAALRDLAAQHNLPLTVTAGKVDEGWVGKAKGMLQVLWERGWVDEARWKDYRLVARDPDDDDRIIESLSLKYLMESCHDFQNEVTQLQTIASLYGMRVEMTPKYHAEIAGCGIEYSWGAAKSRYRQIPLEKKRKKSDFKEAVRHSIDVLTTPTVRKCDRKARTYIQAYYYLEVMCQGEVTQPEEQLSLSTIEKVQKDFKVHRSAIDFDRSFCCGLVNNPE
jgi:hypothetical protein